MPIGIKWKVHFSNHRKRFTSRKQFCYFADDRKTERYGNCNAK